MMSIDLEPDSEESARKRFNVRQSGEIELRETLQKKNTSGIYQSRFFTTKGYMLHYWTSKADYEKDADPSNSYDLREMNSLEVASKRNLTLLFGSAKFKLELRALTDDQCLHWAEFLKSKKSLHSLSDLINELDGDVEFKTEAFRVLMKLREHDQVRRRMSICIHHNKYF